MATNNIYLISLLLLTLSAAGCKGKHNRVTVQNEEEQTAPRLASTVLMGDAKAGAQLLSGFYAIENGSWRWTAGKFSVLLMTPPSAAKSGATLNLALTVPEAVTKKLKSVKLTASINGMALNSAEYGSPGAYAFSADVPATAFTTDSVKVDFALDKSMAPDVDRRELGIIATSVGLVGK